MTMSKLFPFFYPILLFLDGFFVKPYGSLKATEDVYLGVTTLFILLTVFILFISTSYFSREMVLFLIFLIIPIISSPKTWLYGASYFLHILLAFSVLNKYKDRDVTGLLYRLLLTYISISVIVYLQRGLDYNWSFLRLRGGFNIWGGSPLLGAIVLFRIVSIIKGKFDAYKHLDWLFIVLSLAYISRSGIFISILYVIGSIKLRRAYMLLLPLFLWRIMSGGLLYELLQLILMRIGSDDMLGERSLLWRQVLEILIDEPLGVGYGGFQSYSDYSSAHNLTLNILLEFGLIFGLAFIVYIFYSFVLVISNCFPKRKLLFLYILAFFIIGHTSGFKLVQTNGYISAIQLWFFFAMIPPHKNLKIREVS